MCEKYIKEEICYSCFLMIFLILLYFFVEKYPLEIMADKQAAAQYKAVVPVVADSLVAADSLVVVDNLVVADTAVVVDSQAGLAHRRHSEQDAGHVHLRWRRSSR